MRFLPRRSEEAQVSHLCGIEISHLGRRPPEPVVQRSSCFGATLHNMYYATLSKEAPMEGSGA